MKTKKYKPVSPCVRIKTYEKDLLVAVRLTGGYAILKKIKDYWKLGTIKFKNDEKKIVEVNLFKQKPEYNKKTKKFTINENLIPNISFSFKENVLFFSSLRTGFIRKDYVKRMPA